MINHQPNGVNAEGNRNNNLKFQLCKVTEIQILTYRKLKWKEQRKWNENASIENRLNLVSIV